ncbi:MAG: 2-oxoacid:acceptor oxidoreductase family protein [Candidatus Omnitrophota bacterium]|jgi:2-oxoglutarate ferredoxin oxidoreductase subunit gamma
MTEKIIIAGSGGQGIMLLGKVLAEAASKDGLNITWFPTYGAEVRGGAAHCMVIISSQEIPSPYVNQADTLIVMNELSLLKFRRRIKDKGLLLVNKSLVNYKITKHKLPNIKQFYLPFTEAAIKLGNIKVSNMVALGSYIAKKKIPGKQIVFAAIKEIAPPGKKDLIQINKQAIEEGIRIIG